ncbi:MAG: hypothetical protein ACK5JR_01045 [Tropicimonas sp.]
MAKISGIGFGCTVWKQAFGPARSLTPLANSYAAMYPGSRAI